MLPQLTRRRFRRAYDGVLTTTSVKSRRIISERSEGADGARVAEHNIEAAVLFDSTGDGFLDLFLVGDVAASVTGPVCSDGGDYLETKFILNVGNDHTSPMFDEQSCSCFTNAATAPVITTTLPSNLVSHKNKPKLLFYRC
ncbi:hypothetical protein HAX54_023463 [Datura stramonium]|uniref:Uncharacterized protein n=1 Tax=Datura stramonium TaxID=4076 RepID=A0ABS8S4X6_DATST|nr:hypothetical protein [Datura stramonium]